MTYCERYEILLSALGDDQLESSSERFEAVDHLATCAACRRFWRDARALVGALELAGLAPARTAAPPVVRERLVAAATPRSTQRWRTPVWSLPLAAAVILLVGVVMVLSSAPKLGPESTGELGNRVAVELGSDGGAMSEARFVELTTELLRADDRYRLAMLSIMEEVSEASHDREFSRDEIAGGEDRRDAAERPGRV